MGNVAKAVAGPAIGAAGGIVGGILGSRAQNKATEAQERANQQALAFSREQEATRKANYDRAYGMWDASRQELMRRYGITLPASTAPTLTAPGAAQASPAGTLGAAVRRPPAQMPTGQTLGQIAQVQAPPEEPQGEWNDWRRYGLRS